MAKKEKPFTNNPYRKLAHFHKALTAVMEAIDQLDIAQTHAEHWADYETIGYFKHELQAWLSCDNDETGFEPFLRASLKASQNK